MASFAKDDDDVEFENVENTVMASINEEIRIYTGMKTESVTVNVLDWWAINSQQLPTLAKAARFILGIPASSAAPERNFSAADCVVTERRNALSPSTVEDILVCHGNADIKDKIATAVNVI